MPETADEILKILGEDEGEETQESAENENQDTEEKEAEQPEQESSGGEEQTTSEEEETQPEGRSETPDEEHEQGGQKSEEETEEDSELAQLRKQNEKLQQQLNEVSQKVPQGQPQQGDSKEGGQEETSSLDALKEYSFDNIVESEETFWKFVNDLITQVQTKTEEQTMRKIPQVVQTTAQEQMNLREKANAFYSNNPDLAHSKPFVANIVNQVYSEHPDWSFDDMLSEAADRARDALGLEKQAKQSENQNQNQSQDKGNRNPGFAKTGQKSSRRQEGSGKSELEKEIDGVLNT